MNNAFKKQMLGINILDILPFSIKFDFFFKEIINVTFFLSLRFFIVLFLFKLTPPQDFFNLVRVLITCVIVLIVLGVVAFYTLLERKGIAAVQRREGPNVTGPFGLLQPVADGVKLILKEVESADDTDSESFDVAPILSFILSYAGWLFLPIGLEIGAPLSSDFTILFFLAISSLSIYSLFLAGWSSNSKYALLGSVRAVSQFITYEVFFSLLLLPLILSTHSISLSFFMERQLNTSFVWAFLPIFIIFYITMLVETNRAPFDMPEAEAELVAGFNVEYSSVTFALFFLAEYNSMLVASTIMTVMFFGGDNFNFLAGDNSYTTLPLIVYIIKILVFCYSFVFVRANFPRVRYDQLLMLGWKVCLPVSLSYVYLFTVFYLTFTNFSI